MDNYDSILKEKKVYVDPEPIVKKSKFTKYFFIDVVLSVLLLVISYVVYYHSVLTPRNILNHHFDDLKKEVSVIFDPLLLSFDNNKYYLEGNLSFGDYKYDYHFIRNGDECKVQLDRNDSNLTYYIHGDYSYFQSNHLLNGNYIEKKQFQQINSIYNFFANYSNIIDDVSVIKNFFIKDGKPIVEINFSLDNEHISQLLGSGFSNDIFEVIVTIRINGLSGSLIDSKYIINNKTKNTRDVFDYNGSILRLIDNNGNNTIFELTKNKKDFSLKISKGDTIYSVLNGTISDDDYLYSYQIIDKIYNLKLSVSSVDNIIYYKFHSNIMLDDQTIEENMEIQKKDGEEILFDEKLSGSFKFNDLNTSEQESVNQYINEFLSPIREFVDKYKDGIN